MTSPRGCTWAPGLQLGRAWVAAGLPDTICDGSSTSIALSNHSKNDNDSGNDK